MEYIYSALLLHSAGKEITEEAVEKVMKAAGIEPDPARVKALVASLKEVNIEEAIKSAAIAPQAAAQPASASAAAQEEKKEEEKKEEEEAPTEEEALSGLGALFG